MRIVIDAMGGDHAPKAIIDGVKKALKKHRDIQIILTGKQEVLQPMLAERGITGVQIVPASQIIENDESPTVAIKQKTDSSLMVAFELLKEGKADALISAGSTGAILAGGFTRIGRISGISRPALAPVLPTKTGNGVLLLDVGANMDCKSMNLLHFALMGSVYMKANFGLENPRVGLLNVGAEEKKGNELTKEVYDLLKNEPNINFIGNMEARYIMSGDYDVVVADGFSGNVALKAIEGAVSLAMGEVKRAFKGVKGLVAGMFVSSRLKKSKGKLDYNKYGGSPFLGCKKIIIKSHGSSKPETIKACIEQALHLHETNYIQKVEGAFEALKDSNEEII